MSRAFSTSIRAGSKRGERSIPAKIRSASGKRSLTADTEPLSMSLPASRVIRAAMNSSDSSISSGADASVPPVRISVAARLASPALSGGSKIAPVLKSIAASISGSSWSSNR